MSSGKTVLGILAALSAGIIIGVLFAPAKGSETRKKIGKKGSDLKDKLNDKWSSLVAGVEETPDATAEEGYSHN